jgi:hypothetical protein
MAQGWSINLAGEKIRFFEPPPNGTNNIVVTERASGGSGGTDVFAAGAWSGRYGYPREVEFFADRLWFASTRSDPQTLWASNIGDYSNFGKSSPMVDSDALGYSINARHVNVIRELAPLDNLLAMTTGGEFKVTGGQDEVVSQQTINARPQGNAGIGDLPACVIGDSALFLQEEGQKLRDLRYQFEKDGFRGNDISVWAEHLFKGHSFTGLDYWKAPWQVAWLTRADGIRIGCTYMPEQEVIGWHWHDTDGKFMDTCVLPGKSESECYYLVQREINGETVQCIEQQAPTEFPSEDDLFYVDCGLTYDGRNTAATTMTATSLTGGWTRDDDLQLTASASVFAAGDVGDAIELWVDVSIEDDDGEVEVERRKRQLVIEEVVSGTVANVRPSGELQAELRNVALSSWTFQRDKIVSLWHLEGKRVMVLQDSAVAGPFTVENGEVTLESPGGVVHVGLRFVSEVHTLELNTPGGEGMRDMNKAAHKVSVLLLASRGVKAGGARGPLYPVKERNAAMPFDTVPFLKTGVYDSEIPSEWGPDAGVIRIVSDVPLPMEILSLTTRAVASNAQHGGSTR